MFKIIQFILLHEIRLYDSELRYTWWIHSTLQLSHSPKPFLLILFKLIFSLIPRQTLSPPCLFSLFTFANIKGPYSSKPVPVVIVKCIINTALTLPFIPPSSHSLSLHPPPSSFIPSRPCSSTSLPLHPMNSLRKSTPAPFTSTGGV